MSGTSKVSRIVSIRLAVSDIRRIKELIEKPASNETSVSSYCKTAVIRYLNRHTKVIK